MKELDIDIENQIHELLFKATDQYNNENHIDAIETLKSGLVILPGEAYEFDLGYSLVNEICEKAYASGNKAIAREWLELYLKCDSEQRGFGNSELLAGKFAFEDGDYENALNYFKIADSKSGGRVWRGEKNPQFFMFFKKK